jgi:DNA-binding transcriptional MerR regulator
MTDTAAPTTYTISQLAGEFGLTARTLRHYEDKGLLKPARRGQTRLYSRRDRARLERIVLGRRIGLPLDQIAELLSYQELSGADPAHLRTALARLEETRMLLAGRQLDIGRAVADLDATCELIKGLLASFDRG